MRTSRRWMHQVGYKYGVWKKGVFIDGHERNDVVRYRIEFLKRAEALEPRMKSYSGDDMMVWAGVA